MQRVRVGGRDPGTVGAVQGGGSFVEREGGRMEQDEEVLTREIRAHYFPGRPGPSQPKVGHLQPI